MAHGSPCLPKKRNVYSGIVFDVIKCLLYFQLLGFWDILKEGAFLRGYVKNWLKKSVY